VIRRLPLVILAVLAATLTLPAAGSAQGRPAPEADGWIVVYKDSVSSVTRESDQLERQQGFDTQFRYHRALKGFAARLSPGQVAALRRDPQVAYVAPNRIVHATEDVAGGESVPPGIQRMRAFTAGGATTPGSAGTMRGRSDVGVAVIDTGIDLDHPDLAAVSGKNCVGSGPAQDDHGHGTHVAGTIAARNNGSGVVGIAPGTTVYAVKVLNSAGSGTSAQVICGIDWVTANAGLVKVANMSLGGVGPALKACPAAGSTGTSGDPEHDAICASTRVGVAYAVAAGNSAYDFDYASQPDTPAAYPEVVTVSAMGDSNGNPGGGGAVPACRTGEADDRYASFSNYAATAGGRAHTLAAPGVCVRSTFPRALATTDAVTGYATMSGTSMATPHVAGALALCKATDAPAGQRCDPNESSPATLIPKLVSTEPSYGFAGDPFQPRSSTQYYGYLALAGTPPPPSPSFTVSSAQATRTVRRGQSTTYDVTVTPRNGFGGAVALSVSGLKSGASATFTPQTTPATANPSSSVLRITTTSRATRGTFTLTITGRSGTLTRTASVTLTVSS
jgi:subtilisin